MPSGGAGRGQGRIGNIAGAAYRLQQMTARKTNRDALDPSQLAISIGCVRAALADLETEQQRRAQEQPMSVKSQWIGAEGGAFERVGLAFQALGYRAPRPDGGADGAYGMNIVAQYRADLSEAEALAVVRWGLASTRAELESSDHTLAEIAGLYGA